MLGSEILDVAIGLIFVYILVSVICSAIREGIEAWMKTRATYLEHGIRELLQDRNAQGLARNLFEHPMIFGLFSSSSYKPGSSTERPSMMRRGTGLPSYIPSKNFAMALMDIAARGPSDTALAAGTGARPITLENIRRNITTIQNPAVQRVLLIAVDSAQGDLDKAQKNLQDWYDSAMDRVSGWYKRSTHYLLLAIGLVVAVAMNIDTLAIVDRLYTDEGARAAAVEAAGSTAADITYAQAKQALQDIDLPIGWRSASVSFDPPANWWIGFFGPWVGWILTAFAASLGAPFWFDVLNKVMVIRSTVKPREKSPEEGSEDRQPRAATATPSTTQATASAGGAAPSAAPPPAGAADPHNEVDGCDVVFTEAPETSDEQLPAAEGGVA